MDGHGNLEGTFECGWLVFRSSCQSSISPKCSAALQDVCTLTRGQAGRTRGTRRPMAGKRVAERHPTAARPKSPGGMNDALKILRQWLVSR